ncbi:MAG: hypothetical protein IJV22_03140 [Bacteroidales bacterium]|nr:hypothetical protein [Bacteroidales bacterium]
MCVGTDGQQQGRFCRTACVLIDDEPVDNVVDVLRWFCTASAHLPYGKGALPVRHPAMCRTASCRMSHGIDVLCCTTVPERQLGAVGPSAAVVALSQCCSRGNAEGRQLLGCRKK